MTAKHSGVRRLACIFIALFALITVTSGADSPDSAIWIDVRTAGEFSAGHVEDALLIPWQSIEKGVAGLNLSRDATIYVYCAVGGRSEKARLHLEKAGYTRVINAGGLDDARKLKKSLGK